MFMGLGSEKVKFPNEKKLVKTSNDRYVIVRKDIPGYFNELFYSSMRIWRRSEKWGLPNGKGWLYEKEDTLRIIDIFDEEFNFFQAEEMKING